MVGLLRAEGWWAGRAAAANLVEESDVETLSAAEDPWDETVNIPAGTNRVLLWLFCASNTGATTVALDPAGDNIALTEDANSPQAFSAAAENALAFALLEASFPGTTGNKTIRANPSSNATGGGRLIVLSGASQTLFSAGNSVDNNTALTVTATHPVDTFAAGSRVYTVMMAQGALAYTVTGDVTEVSDQVVGTDQYVYAEGVLASAQATASATFTQDGTGIRRKQAILIVVEPA